MDFFEHAIIEMQNIIFILQTIGENILRKDVNYGRKFI